MIIKTIICLITMFSLTSITSEQNPSRNSGTLLKSSNIFFGTFETENYQLSNDKHTLALDNDNDINKIEDNDLVIHTKNIDALINCDESFEENAIDLMRYKHNTKRIKIFDEKQNENPFSNYFDSMEQSIFSIEHHLKSAFCNDDTSVNVTYILPENNDNKNQISKNQQLITNLTGQGFKSDSSLFIPLNKQIQPRKMIINTQSQQNYNSEFNFMTVNKMQSTNIPFALFPQNSQSILPVNSEDHIRQTLNEKAFSSFLPRDKSTTMINNVELIGNNFLQFKVKESEIIEEQTQKIEDLSSYQKAILFELQNAIPNKQYLIDILQKSQYFIVDSDDDMNLISSIEQLSIESENNINILQNQELFQYISRVFKYHIPQNHKKRYRKILKKHINFYNKYNKLFTKSYQQSVQINEYKNQLANQLNDIKKYENQLNQQAEEIREYQNKLNQQLEEILQYKEKEKQNLNSAPKKKEIIGGKKKKHQKTQNPISNSVISNLEKPIDEIKQINNFSNLNSVAIQQNYQDSIEVKSNAVQLQQQEEVNQDISNFFDDQTMVSLNLSTSQNVNNNDMNTIIVKKKRRKTQKKSSNNFTLEEINTANQNVWDNQERKTFNLFESQDSFEKSSDSNQRQNQFNISIINGEFSNLSLLSSSRQKTLPNKVKNPKNMNQYEVIEELDESNESDISQDARYVQSQKYLESQQDQVKFVIKSEHSMVHNTSENIDQQSPALDIMKKTYNSVEKSFEANLSKPGKIIFNQGNDTKIYTKKNLEILEPVTYFFNQRFQEIINMFDTHEAVSAEFKKYQDLEGYIDNPDKIATELLQVKYKEQRELRDNFIMWLYKQDISNTDKKHLRQIIFEIDKKMYTINTTFYKIISKKGFNILYDSKQDMDKIRNPIAYEIFSNQAFTSNQTKISDDKIIGEIDEYSNMIKISERKNRHLEYSKWNLNKEKQDRIRNMINMIEKYNYIISCFTKVSIVNGWMDDRKKANAIHNSEL